MKITPEKETAFIEKIERLEGGKDSTKESLQGFVTKHYPMLKAARDRGNSYEEIALIFDEMLSFTIRPDTLRKYMSQAKKKRSAQDAQGTSEKSISVSTRESKSSHQKTQTKSLSPERKASLLSSRSSKDISNEFPTL